MAMAIVHNIINSEDAMNLEIEEDLLQISRQIEKINDIAFLDLFMTSN